MSGELAGVRVRLGRTEDAPALVSLSAFLHKSALLETEHAWRRRLMLAHGDDDFVLVAGDDEGVDGYVWAGGSTEPGAKGCGEIFAIAVAEKDARARRALIEEALLRLRRACYASVVGVRERLGDDGIRQLEDVGFVADPHRPGLVRISEGRPPDIET